MVQVYGNFQRFEFGGISVTLNLADSVYKVGLGETYLEQIGYDRILKTDLEPEMFYGWAGASHVDGPPHPAPFEFFWDLQYLPPETYRKLMAIYRLSRAAQQPVRLYDGLLVLDEVAPRTRGKVGSYIETEDGIDYYFPIFDVWLKLGQQTRIGGRHYLKLTGQEFDPDQPVTGDAAA